MNSWPIFGEVDGPITAVCVVVVNEGQLLAVSRKDDPNALGLPGGKVEEGETLEAAAARECLEETGITVLGLTPFLTQPARTRLCRSFRAASFSGTLQTSEEGIPQWVEPDRILNGPWPQYNVNVLARLREEGTLK